MFYRILFQTLIFLALAPVYVQAKADRVALIIGNGAYTDVPSLVNPENDAQDISASLRRIGFRVTTHINLKSGEFNRALRDFSRAAEDADMAVLYFAGHGLEIDNKNYLIPVDARMERASDVTYEAVALPKFLQSVSGAKTLRLVLLDACRNNPFLAQIAKNETRSLNRGLARVEPSGGILVGYAARGGTVAYDGEGRNSPYAAALLKYLEEPNLEIGKLFRRVRDSVYNTTLGLQEPFTYGSLPAKDIYLSAARPNQPSQSEVLRNFARADLQNTQAGWTEFLDGVKGTVVDPKIIRRARNKLALLQQGETGQTPAILSSQSSPLIRACDKLAADPDDEERPDEIAGVPTKKIDLNPALTACKLAVAGHEDHARSLYQLGRVQSAAGKGKEGYEIHQLAAALGYMAAQIAVAEIKIGGALEARDLEGGYALLEEAMNAGSIIAPRKLGYYRLRNFNLNSGLKSTDYYRIAADRGDIESAYTYGRLMVSKSQLTLEDRALGVRYLTTAADAGMEQARIKLASYFYQNGPDFDPRVGHHWYEMAAKAGSLRAINRLIQIHKLGKYVPADSKKAAQWARIAADNGDPPKSVETGYNFEVGRGVARDPEKAADYYFKAVVKGDKLALKRRFSEWDRQTAQALQTLLKRSSTARYMGPIDGVVGSGTLSALSRLCGCKSPYTGIRYRDIF